MKILVTAGSTEIPIDQVRIISNVFSGRTGTTIADYCAKAGNEVILLTSNPGLVKNRSKLTVLPYRTFDDLAELMEREINGGNYDVIIHSAAVSDFKVAGAYVKKNGKMRRVDNRAKISSSHEKLYLELVPTEKLIDKIRRDWNFHRILVKFKLQVDISDEELLAIAEKSLAVSNADFIVANCLEWSDKYAYIMTTTSRHKVTRGELPNELYRRIKQCASSSV